MKLETSKEELLFLFTTLYAVIENDFDLIFGSWSFKGIASAERDADYLLFSFMVSFCWIPCYSWWMVIILNNSITINCIADEFINERTKRYNWIFIIVFINYTMIEQLNKTKRINILDSTIILYFPIFSEYCIIDSAI